MSLSKNTAWNLVGTGAPILVGLITIPYLISNIGLEAFGILTLIWALIGYFTLFDFGLGRALTQKIASCLVSHNVAEIPRMVKLGLILTFLTGLLGGLILLIIAAPLGYSWLNVTVDLQEETVLSLVVAAIGIPLVTLTTGARGVIEAFEDFKSVNILRIILGIANFGLPALSVMYLGKSLIYIVITLIIARFVVLIAHILVMNKKLESKWFKCKTKLKQAKDLIAFGAWMTVSNIISPLMVTADRFIISSLLGATVVAYYTVPSDMLMRVLILPAALTGALFPRLSSLLASDRQSAFILYKKSLKFVAVSLLAVCILIILGSHIGLELWLGKDFADHSWIIVCIFSVGIYLNSVAFVPYAAIQAAGNAQLTAYLHIFEFIIYFPMLLGGIVLFGLYGAAMVWVFRVGLDLFLLTFFVGKTSFSNIKIN